MQTQIINNECPCCHAPLPAHQEDDNAIVCNHCGAEIILKLPLDERIEQFAFNEILSMTGLTLIPVVLLGETVLVWFLWRFWLRNAAFFERPLWRVLIFLVVAAYNLLLIWILIKDAASTKRCLEECGRSRSKLKQLVKIQPTYKRKSIYKQLEEEIKEINKKLDL